MTTADGLQPKPEGTADSTVETAPAELSMFVKAIVI